MAETEKQSDIASLTVELLSAYLSNNTVPSAELAGLIQSTRAALTQDAAPVETEADTPTFTPAVTARKSLASPDHLISLIDGKPYKTLKRHLTRHGLTPETYRERYGLPASYPMVAPSFAAMRRAIAEKIGLGNKKAADAVVPADAVAGADAAEATDVAATVAAKPKKQAAKTAAVKAAKAPARKAKAPAKPTVTSAEMVTAPVANVADNPVEPQVAEQAVETPGAPPTATKAPARGAAPKKQPTKRMARTPKSAAKSEATAPVSEENSPAEITDSPAAAEKPKRRGKLGLFGKEASDIGVATGTPAPAPGTAKTRWKRPAAKAK
ncbi:MucR family transcriptional regulator [Novosphingobium sp. P6W]|uniref:MucR family transcriptional regulator n=1 Tax=Novosphingobium sp. P6W TaxID=1609758 RepID=UPI000DE8A6EB|nr:MucR family transcriptional regulator [Novosphingobium sp. P6W]AXB80071.1 transcriptional regulator [Novosphingobium sp. P6W]